jgi:hypothetical protein
MSTTTDRTVEQRREALRRANVIRACRARLKINIRAGRVSVPDLLLDPPGWLLTMKAWDLVLAQPKYGFVKTAKVFNATGMSPSKTVGGMSVRQRRVLVNELRARS